VLNVFGLVLSLLCVVTGFWHQQTAGWNEGKTLLIFSLVVAAVHLVFYTYRFFNQIKLSRNNPSI